MRHKSFSSKGFSGNFGGGDPDAALEQWEADQLKQARQDARDEFVTNHRQVLADFSKDLRYDRHVKGLGTDKARKQAEAGDDVNKLVGDLRTNPQFFTDGSDARLHAIIEAGHTQGNDFFVATLQSDLTQTGKQLKTLATLHGSPAFPPLSPPSPLADAARGFVDKHKDTMAAYVKELQYYATKTTQALQGKLYRSLAQKIEGWMKELGEKPDQFFDGVKDAEFATALKDSVTLGSSYESIKMITQLRQTKRDFDTVMKQNTYVLVP